MSAPHLLFFFCPDQSRSPPLQVPFFLQPDLSCFALSSTDTFWVSTSRVFSRPPHLQCHTAQRVAFPSPSEWYLFCGVLTSPDFGYHPSLPAPPLLKKCDTKSTATRTSRRHSPILMERVVSSYLEWQLNVDPLTLCDFSIAFSKILPCRTCLKPPPQTACPCVDCACTT